jgi:hypothetical protein
MVLLVYLREKVKLSECANIMPHLFRIEVCGHQRVTPKLALESDTPVVSYWVGEDDCCVAGCDVGTGNKP